MDSFTANKRNNGHSRSISLPSRPHPSTANVEEHLCRLRSSESISPSLLCSKLSGLKELYECVDDLLNLPLGQQKICSCSEDVLGSSLRLLDLCSAIKDAFLQMRASGRDLESSLRRRDINVSSKIRSYLICINKVNKMISKCFKSINKSGSNKSSDTLSTVSMLREVEELSITIFESLLSSVGTALKQKSWSLVKKFTQSKQLSANEENMSEAYKLQMNLEALYKHKDSDILKNQQVQKCLVALDTSMEQYEEYLNSLSRSLIKTRVSILNVLNH